MERPLALEVDGSDSSLEAVDEAARHGLSVRLVRGSLRGSITRDASLLPHRSARPERSWR